MLQARQGVSMIQAEGLRVVDEAMADVPADGSTMGEIVMRGNNVMAGYYLEPEATAEAFRGGWFHSGDLGVMHPDGYIELRDRIKDVVISGGENISTVEVEQALMSHPAVLEAAVIGVPDDKWGERPKAFVVIRAGTPQPRNDRRSVRIEIAPDRRPATPSASSSPRHPRERSRSSCSANPNGPDAPNACMASAMQVNVPGLSRVRVISLGSGRCRASSGPRLAHVPHRPHPLSERWPAQPPRCDIVAVRTVTM